MGRRLAFVDLVVDLDKRTVGKAEIGVDNTGVDLEGVDTFEVGEDIGD